MNYPQKCLLVALGGSLGALARFLVGSAVANRLGTRFPYGTFVINLTACIVLGFSLEYLGRHMEIAAAWRYLVATGFIGAYSTFSTFEWETFSTLQAGNFLIAGTYVALSVLLGLFAVWMGVLIAKIVP
jgi:CrcB protein